MRKPPHSQKAEAALIASVLNKPALIYDTELRPDQFFDRRNEEIWRTVLEILLDGGEVDHITVAERLDKDGKLSAAGGVERFLEINDFPHTKTAFADYADIVKDAHHCRSQIEIMEGGIQKAYEGDDATSEIIGSLAELSYGVNEEVCTNEKIISSWESAASGNIPTIPTPFDDLNRFFGGVKEGMHTIFTGASGSGKSMFLAFWYLHLGKLGIPVLAMPFEDGEAITKTRMAACLGGYKWNKIENGGEHVRINGRNEWVKVTRRELEKAVDCLREIDKLPIHFDARRCTKDELLARIADAKSRYGIRIAFMDGAKDIRRPTGKYNDTGYDEEISQEACFIAEKLGIALVSIYHLTKIPPNELITDGNIRGSGNIVGDSRCAMALQRGGLDSDGVIVNRDDIGIQTTRSIDIIKSNHSRLGRIVLDTDLSRIKFWKQEAL